MISEKLLDNQVARAWNLDLLHVMKKRELVAKAVFDGAALVATISFVRAFLAQPNLQSFDGIKYVIIAVGGDLIINFVNRRYWLARTRN